jgi:DtxR family transcriptional regulator, Mn-dependent transcriptional regulator
VIRHHRLVESFLCQVLGYSWDEVHEEAERLEHVISESMEDRMAVALGNPVIDPHGDPIPDREGHITRLNSTPLTQFPEEMPAIIQRVVGQEPEMLRYLADVGLTLFTKIKVISKAPFNGPVNVALKSRPGSILSLGRNLTDQILVMPYLDTLTEPSNE